MVKGKRIPPAMFMEISGHVWMLEKINAKRKFLVFGNDIRVPKEWLKRYGKFLKDIEFSLSTLKETSLSLDSLNLDEKAKKSCRKFVRCP